MKSDIESPEKMDMNEGEDGEDDLADGFDGDNELDESYEPDIFTSIPLAQE